MKHLNEMDRKLMGLKIKRAYQDMSVAYNSESIDKAIDRIEKSWEKAKSKRLFKMFGDKLIVEKEILIEKDVNQLASEIGELYHPYLRRLDSNLRNAYSNDLMSRDLYYMVSSMLYCSLDLATNRVSNSFEFSVEGVKPFKVNKGQKTMKFFQKLNEIFEIDSDCFEDFRLKHSQILNDKKIKGVLTLSIHPLDYMTMSDNANGWESCMSWDDEGCYRAGTLECMNCEGTIVAYLSSTSTEYFLGEDESGEKQYWNSKKYRQLVTIDDNAILTNKGYPYQNDNLSNEVLNFVAELAGEEYKGENYSLDNYSPFYIDGLRGIELKTYCFMYNDIDNGARPFFRLNKNFETSSRKIIEMKLGGQAYCIVCGLEVDDQDGLTCYDCHGGERYYCDNCGDCMCEDEVYTLEGDILCECCYSESAACCEWCEQDSYEFNMIYIDSEEAERYINSDTEDHPTSGYYCECCFNNHYKPLEEEEQ